MTVGDELSERELRVLAATIKTYIETAEPAGSKTIAERSGLGISAASIRTTMGDLEAKGYLFHRHTSAGRIPTDRGYRVYVNSLSQLPQPSQRERARLHSELEQPNSAIEEILRRAAQVLGVLTQELGVAMTPTFDGVVLERLELVSVSSDRLLLVLTLQSGLVRTIFVGIPGTVVTESIVHVTRTLNERLAGLSLRDIRASLADRLRDADGVAGGRELLNIFVAQGEEIFDLESNADSVMLGSAQMLAEQPEFASNDRMRELLQLTERRDLLKNALEARGRTGMSITIGAENSDPRFAGFTLVTSAYRSGELTGVIGVLGPTRMPYEKIIGLVDHTSRLVEGLMA